MSWTGWDLALVPLLAAVVTLALFARGFLRRRRRGGARYVDGWRVGLILLALAFATLPLVSPLAQAGDDYLLSAHMLQHVLLADAAPALLLVALRGPLLLAAARRRLARARALPCASRCSRVSASSFGQPRRLGARDRCMACASRV